MRNEVAIRDLVMKLTQPYADSCQWLECDGLTRVLHRVLFDAGITKQQVCFGSVLAAVVVNAADVGISSDQNSSSRSHAKRLVIPNHYWIELEIEGEVESSRGVGRNDYGLRKVIVVVDYRLLWWVLGGKDKLLPPEYAGVLPHGVFNSADYPQVEYQRAAIIDEPVIGDALFEALTNVEFNTVLPPNFFAATPIEN
jgi:hypothetical protein